MSVFSIFICIILLLLLILTERALIVIKEDEGFSVELHFIFFAFTFGKKKGDGKKALSISFYRMLIKRLFPLIRHSEIMLVSVTPPKFKDGSTIKNTFYPLGCYFLVSALSLMASESVRRVNISERCRDSFFKNSSAFKFNISFRIRVFYIVYALIPVLFEFFKEKKKKPRVKDVRN